MELVSDSAKSSATTFYGSTKEAFFLIDSTKDSFFFIDSAKEAFFLNETLCTERSSGSKSSSSSI